MRSTLQQTLLSSLGGVLRPIISLCLRCGIGYDEFRYLARGLFVSVAAQEYGLRGRPTNSSRIAAMTGISRKEVTKIRQELDENSWTPAEEVTPANLILHYWHFDKDFCAESGAPNPLRTEGAVSFAELVRRYAGDIPSGAVKEELKRAAVVSEEDGVLTVKKRYFQPEELHEDFIRNIMFSLHNLACTVVHNAALVSRDDFTSALNDEQGRFERFAWSDQLDAEARIAFRHWVREEGARFIERADHWIGNHELLSGVESSKTSKSIGVGVYFFDNG